MSGGPAGRDDSAVMIAVCIADSELDSIHDANSDPAGLAVIEAIVAAFKDRSLEDSVRD